jgi:diguanylate cyclase (GGDEF)-like protein
VPAATVSAAQSAQPDHNSRLRAEAVRQLCEQLPASLLNTVALTMLLVTLFWNLGNHSVLLIWAAMLLFVTALRMELYHRYRSNARHQFGQLEALCRPLRAGSFVAGLIWGGSALAFYPVGNSSAELIHTLMLTGISAGAMTSLASDRISASLFQGALLLPLVFQQLAASREQPYHLSIGIMVVLYGTHVFASTRRMHRQITENIKLRLAADQRERTLQDSEQRFRQLAHHDALTGLLNRYSLQSCLAESIVAANRTRSHLALIYIDVDNFKYINDDRGHDCGDQMLITIANRLRASVAEDDFIVRMGGDEFVVLTTHAESRTVVSRLARTIGDVMAEPMPIGKDILHAQVSIGIGMYPDDAADASELLKFADIALYQAKAGGRNTHQFFAEGMREKFQERISLERALAQAVGTPQLYLQYQPIVDLATQRIISLEALLRWEHPERGLVSPSTFIPIAEGCGLIGDLGEHALRLACEQLRAWQREMVPLVPIALNVSARQFRQGSVAAQIARCCAEYDIDTRLIQVELTESMLMEHFGQFNVELQSLRELGISVAIDDFGVGYSSLSYLKHLPVDCLKIDRSFVHDMVADVRDTTLVGAVIGIAHSLGMRIVAEGVETERQAELLAELKCDATQGFYFHRPMSAENCRPLLEQLLRRSTGETMRMKLLSLVTRQAPGG